MQVDGTFVLARVRNTNTLVTPIYFHVKLPYTSSFIGSMLASMEAATASMEAATASMEATKHYHSQPDPTLTRSHAVHCSRLVVQKYNWPSAGTARGREREARTVIVMCIAIINSAVCHTTWRLSGSCWKFPSTSVYFHGSFHQL